MIARFGQPPTILVDVAQSLPLQDELEPYWGSPQGWPRRAAWITARSRGGWLELLACLRLVQDQDAALSAEGIGATRGWATRTTIAGRPAPAVAAALEHNLRRAHDGGLLPRRTADLIAFTGGLTRYTHVATVPSTQPSAPHAGSLWARILHWRRR